MGRKATTYPNMPKGLRPRPRGKTIYYYYDTGAKPRKEIPLGTDYVTAVQKWAELEQQKTEVVKSLITFRYAAERYVREVIPEKEPRTQEDNIKELRNLLLFFGDGPLDEIRPVHIYQFMEWRHQLTKKNAIEANVKLEAKGKPTKVITGKEGHVRANRERALFSHIFNRAREWGYTDCANPCQGVRKNKETGRNIYIDDSLYQLVYDNASQPLRDYMDFMYLSGQRNADALKADEKQITDGAYGFKQGKGGKRVRVALVGAFGALIDRIRQRKLQGKAISTRLIVDMDGIPMTVSTLRSRFDEARERAGIPIAQFQLRDLRAKAGTDKEESEGMEAARLQLGHGSTQMTQHYVRNLKGKLVNPTK